MEAVLEPSSDVDLCTPSDSPTSENEGKTLKVVKLNGEVNGSSTGEDVDPSGGSKDSGSSRVKKVRGSASKESAGNRDKLPSQRAVSDSNKVRQSSNSPILVEISSDVDSPVKKLFSGESNSKDGKSKSKLEKDKKSSSASRDNDSSSSRDGASRDDHKNGEVMEVDSDGVQDISDNSLCEVDPLSGNGSPNERVVMLGSDDEHMDTGENEKREQNGDINKKSDPNLKVSDGPADDSDALKGSKPPEEGNDKKEEESDVSHASQSTPDKHKSQEKKKAADAKKAAMLSITPRRSSRNLNKQKCYADPGPEVEPDPVPEPEPDIQEITPVDPLAVSAADRARAVEKDPLAPSPVKESPNVVPKIRRKNTIIVNDTKALAQIAANSKDGKKEPTLVIIDTNSILSGRGPVPVNSSPPSMRATLQALPPALPPQSIYTMPPVQVPIHVPPPPPPPKPKGPPGLTDDMYVVEAPSFIVPYVYEKPAEKPLKEYVDDLRRALRELDKKEREEKSKERKQKEKEEKERKIKEEAENALKEKAEKVEQEEDEKEGKKCNTELESEDSEKKKGVKEETMEVDEQEKPKEKELDKDSDEKPSEIRKDDEEEAKVKSVDVEVAEKADAEEKKVKVKEGTGSEDEDEEYDSESDSSDSDAAAASKPKSTSYFDSPLGKFFMQIGVNLVQEHVQTDLLRTQKRKLNKGGQSNPETQHAVNSLLKNLEQSKENNQPYKFKIKRCKFCNFKTESEIVMSHHMEMPHLRNFLYHCNFCSVSMRTNHDMLYHMEAEHNVRARVERTPAFHQCPNCPFEDNQKSKMNRHALSCQKRFRPEHNQDPPLDWEPPAKIPRLAKVRHHSPGMTNNPYLKTGLPQHPLLPKMPSPSMIPSLVSGAVRGRGRPSIASRFLPDLKAMPRPIAPSQMRQGMMYRPSSSQQQVLVPTSYQIAGNQIYQRWSQQVVGGQNQVMPMVSPMPRLTLMSQGGSSSSPVALMPSLSSGSNSITIQQSASSKSPAAKLLQQPSISITPLPRQSSSSASSNNTSSSHFSHPGGKQGQIGGKNSFVICEICDGYIKDLEQLRNHMQWIHKVKIHPKMIYNRPPLNCQKCQFRFFTDQGLERHLLGSHGLVTSSMQEASNKGKDGGRCPVCGRVYQWKLLNHVAKDHNMTLKPAHLSYKCTVCTATFGMYKQFENHVYSAHSVVAKRVMDKKAAAAGSSSSRSFSQSSTESLLKPLKINDEITIIPQPAKSSSSANRGGQRKKMACQAQDSGSESSL